MSNYIDKKKFHDILKEYKKTKDRKTFNEIGKIFLIIATNLLNHPWFVQHSQDRKDEMISDATYYMVKYIDRFDVEKENPFSYFTQVSWNAFLQNKSDYKKRDEMFKSFEYIEDMSFENNSFDNNNTI